MLTLLYYFLLLRITVVVFFNRSKSRLIFGGKQFSRERKLNISTRSIDSFVLIKPAYSYGTIITVIAVPRTVRVMYMVRVRGSSLKKTRYKFFFSTVSTRAYIHEEQSFFTPGFEPVSGFKYSEVLTATFI